MHKPYATERTPPKRKIIPQSSRSIIVLRKPFKPPLRKFNIINGGQDHFQKCTAKPEKSPSSSKPYPISLEFYRPPRKSFRRRGKKYFQHIKSARKRVREEK